VRKVGTCAGCFTCSPPNGSINISPLYTPPDVGLEFVRMEPLSSKAAWTRYQEILIDWLSDVTWLWTGPSCSWGIYIYIYKTPWPEPTNELYRPRDRRLSAKLVPTLAVGYSSLISNDKDLSINKWMVTTLQPQQDLCSKTSFEESHYRSKTCRYFDTEVEQHESTLLHYCLKLFIKTLPLLGYRSVTSSASASLLDMLSNRESTRGPSMER
jgi:hypothetical protein